MNHQYRNLPAFKMWQQIIEDRRSVTYEYANNAEAYKVWSLLSKWRKGVLTHVDREEDSEVYDIAKTAQGHFGIIRPGQNKAGEKHMLHVVYDGCLDGVPQPVKITHPTDGDSDD